MKVCNKLLKIMYKRIVRLNKKTKRKQSNGFLMAMSFGAVIICAAGVSLLSKHLISQESESMNVGIMGVGEVQAAETAETEELQAGLMGVVNGAITMRQYSQAANEEDISSENEEILVGPSHVSRKERRRNMLGKATASARNVFSGAKQVIENHQMPENEYYTLLQIVEAEATGEDLEGKLLVANVILNRVKDERFPDTIEEVVWQVIGGSAQFQPTIDGRINTVVVTEDTIRAVDLALAGEDYSQGALFFMARDTSEDVSVGWFDGNLIPLFEHGGHEYYTLSKEAVVS